MNKFSAKKKCYYKPTIVLEVIDYTISSMTPSLPGDPGGMMKNPNTSPTKDQSTSPFGGSRPNYK